MCGLMIVCAEQRAVRRLPCASNGILVLFMGASPLEFSKSAVYLPLDRYG
jgi:hypothetical protein